MRFGKLPNLAAEHGDALDLRWELKRAIDPDGQMNPGKMPKPLERATRRTAS